MGEGGVRSVAVRELMVLMDDSTCVGVYPNEVGFLPYYTLTCWRWRRRLMIDCLLGMTSLIDSPTSTLHISLWGIRTRLTVNPRQIVL